MQKRILFQGDSITDCGRVREDFYHMGSGYPSMVKGVLGLDFPCEYEFINRGISGDRVVSIYARIKRDFINLKPDYASIYVGVNDVWHEISQQNGVATPKFEKIYSMMLDEIYEACPDIKLMLIAPFVLEGKGTCNDEEHPDRFDRFRRDVDEKIAAVKRIGEKYKLPVIDLQPAFDEGMKKAPSEYWTKEGVHPTACGHEIIKRLWLETFEKIK